MKHNCAMVMMVKQAIYLGETPEQIAEISGHELAEVEAMIAEQHSPDDLCDDPECAQGCALLKIMGATPETVKG